MPDIPANYRRLSGSELHPGQDARLTGASDPNETLQVIVTVRPRPGAPALPDLAYWTTTPPGSRTFLSTEEFGATYGAAPAELDQVVAFARSHGLTVTEKNVARRRVVVSGTVAQMSRAFAVELGRYESPTETHRGYDGYLHLPNEVADLVVSVCGLDNRRVGGGNDTGSSVRRSLPSRWTPGRSRGGTISRAPQRRTKRSASWQLANPPRLAAVLIKAISISIFRTSIRLTTSISPHLHPSLLMG